MAAEPPDYHVDIGPGALFECAPGHLWKDTNMANTRLLQAICAAAMLAAAPAIAQTDTAPALTGAGNSVNAPAADNSSTGNGSSGAMSTHAHHSAMMGHTGKMMHGKGDASQDAAVNQLNDQSYQAAQRGQAFGTSNMGSSGMNSGGMNGMSSGSGATAPDTSNMK